MVNDGAIQPKKKKMKKGTDLDGSVVMKKKKLAELDGSVVKKKKKKIKKGDVKKKKKKSLKRSSLILKQPDSDNDLFGSQSPIKAAPANTTPPISPKQTPISPKQSPEKSHSPQISAVAYLSPASLSDDASSDDGFSAPVVSTPQPVKKFAKKTKIKKAPSTSEYPNKKRKLHTPDIPSMVHPLHPNNLALLVGDGEVLEDIVEEITEGFTTVEVPVHLEEEVPSLPPPLSDPLLSQQDQDLRDLCLLSQVGDKFAGVDEDQVKWNSLFVFSMTPDEMSERFKVLSEKIARKKPVDQLVRESIQAFVRAKVDNIPATSRNYLANRGVYNKPVKVMNAFRLFASRFDQAVVARDEIKEKWELLGREEKAKLKREAKILNNVNGIQKGITRGPKKRSGYNTFTREQMLLGKKMTDIGPLWTQMTDQEKDKYNQEAVEINRERMASAADTAD